MADSQTYFEMAMQLAEQGRTPQVLSLIKNHPEWALKESSGILAMVAAKNGHTETALKIVEVRPEWAVDRYGWSIALEAAAYGHVKKAREMVKEHPKWAADMTGTSIAYMAMKNGYVDEALAMVKEHPAWAIGRDGETIAHVAAARGDWKAAIRTLDEGYASWAFDRNGCSIASAAAEAGQFKALEELLKVKVKGRDGTVDLAHQKDFWHKTPLQYAREYAKEHRKDRPELMEQVERLEKKYGQAGEQEQRNKQSGVTRGNSSEQIAVHDSPNGGVQNGDAPADVAPTHWDAKRIETHGLAAISKVDAPHYGGHKEPQVPSLPGGGKGLQIT